MAGWDKESIEKLKKYYADGLTMSQIASNLKGFSRNAVVGKIHRLNLVLRSTPVAKKPVAPKRKLRHTFTGATIIRPKVSKPLPPEPEGPKIRERIRLGVEFDDDVFFASWIFNLKPALPEMHKIPNSGECKWITGNVNDPHAKWCRKPTLGFSSWCEYHYKLVYISPTERLETRYDYRKKK